MFHTQVVGNSFDKLMTYDVYTTSKANLGKRFVPTELIKVYRHSDQTSYYISYGFGKFHLLLLILCGLIYLDTAIGITLLSFVLPSAQCDLQLTSTDKGWLTASPMFGMMLGSYFWGCLADTQGRKIVLVAALFLDGICGVASSISQYFGLFLFFRLLNGFGIHGKRSQLLRADEAGQSEGFFPSCPVMIRPTAGTELLLPKFFTAHVKCVSALERHSHDGLEEPRKRITGAMGICYPYLGEFQPTVHREKILCWMEIFWTGGVILLPGLAWVIIPLDVRFVSDHFVFGSWNLFVLVCSLPSLLVGTWLLTFPESPKFLMESGRHDEAMGVFKRMYQGNHNEQLIPTWAYLIADIVKEYNKVKSLMPKELKGRTKSIISIESQRSQRDVGDLKSASGFKVLFAEIWDQTKALCKPPHLRNTVLTCAVQFGLTSSYFTLMVWFPELFDRFQVFESEHPGMRGSVCDVSSQADSSGACDHEIDTSVYLHTLIIGLACVPTSFWLPLCVHRLGAKFFLVFSLVVAGGVTIGFYFIGNSTANLVLSCIFEALTSLAISTVFCVMVDLFPTNLRVMAAALSLTFGRAGALIGSLVFGYLIDLNCLVPILLFTALLLGSGGLCLLLPNTGKEQLD
uniref:Major facilitator superfamily (MFS) profile domain-containing protein n=1 Tax=Timema monikensis TaxID=170555 RepID=A0A7R9HMF4_9NEOP|nr:unnamed protein product [Timema monikensis]